MNLSVDFFSVTLAQVLIILRAKSSHTIVFVSRKVKLNSKLGLSLALNCQFLIFELLWLVVYSMLLIAQSTSELLV